MELLVLAPVLVLFALLSVALGRYQMARQQVIGAATTAAEAASVATSAADAGPAALAGASPELEGGSSPCAGFRVLSDTTDFVPGGLVKVTVTCAVDFSDLLVPGLPGSTTVRVAQVAPVDPYRSVG